VRLQSRLFAPIWNPFTRPRHQRCYCCA